MITIGQHGNNLIFFRSNPTVPFYLMQLGGYNVNLKSMFFVLPLLYFIHLLFQILKKTNELIKMTQSISSEDCILEYKLKGERKKHHSQRKSCILRVKAFTKYLLYLQK